MVKDGELELFRRRRDQCEDTILGLLSNYMKWPLDKLQTNPDVFNAINQIYRIEKIPRITETTKNDLSLDEKMRNRFWGILQDMYSEGLINPRIHSERDVKRIFSNYCGIRVQQIKPLKELHQALIWLNVLDQSPNIPIDEVESELGDERSAPRPSQSKVVNEDRGPNPSNQGTQRTCEQCKREWICTSSRPELQPFCPQCRNRRDWNSKILKQQRMPDPNESVSPSPIDTRSRLIRDQELAKLRQKIEEELLPWITLRLPQFYDRFHKHKPVVSQKITDCVSCDITGSTPHPVGITCSKGCDWSLCSRCIQSYLVKVLEHVKVPDPDRSPTPPSSLWNPVTPEPESTPDTDQQTIVDDQMTTFTNDDITNVQHSDLESDSISAETVARTLDEILEDPSLESSPSPHLMEPRNIDVISNHSADDVSVESRAAPLSRVPSTPSLNDLTVVPEDHSVTGSALELRVRSEVSPYPTIYSDDSNLPRNVATVSLPEESEVDGQQDSEEKRADRKRKFTEMVTNVSEFDKNNNVTYVSAQSYADNADDIDQTHDVLDRTYQPLSEPQHKRMRQDLSRSNPISRHMMMIRIRLKGSPQIVETNPNPPPFPLW